MSFSSVNLNGKVLLITGGTGSFGSTVVSKFLDSGVREIRVFSRDEKKQEDMRISLNNERVKFFLGDVRSKRSLRPAVKGADFVFHAAALKQVPSCEFFPMEAVKTNILGAENVLQLASEFNVKRVVVLSTDKAVYPINAMGISKAMMEKITLAKARSESVDGCIMSATRYGNVMASRGSVIPLFIDQMISGGPVTVTDPNMTRFLMSLDDSVDLVMHSFSNAQQRDIFVQKAPAATVIDIAMALSDIFSYSGEIRIIGTRHGEKLFESLLSREEMARAEDHGRYYRVPADGRDLNYGKYFSRGEEGVSISDDYTSHNAQRLDRGGVKELLLSLEAVKGRTNA